MALLLVDLGNTRLRWVAVDEAGRLGRVASVVHAGRELGDVLDGAWSALEPPGRVKLCSVAGATQTAVFSGWVRRRWGSDTEVVQAAAEGWGVRNAYIEPTQLGADRWAALVAARALCPDRPVCIVDCGTAVTVDAMDAEGRHLGGLIAPGLALMRKALAGGTAGIVESDTVGGVPEGVALLARSTRDAVSAGTLCALVALVERVGSELAAELGESMERILTGGDAAQLIPLLESSWRHEPALVLRGLARMATEESCP